MELCTNVVLGHRSHYGLPSCVNVDQLWKLYTYRFRQECKTSGYQCYAKTILSIPYLFLIPRHRLSYVNTHDVKDLYRNSDFTISANYNRACGIYEFQLLKARYPWWYLEHTVEILTYDPVDYYQQIIHSLH